MNANAMNERKSRRKRTRADRRVFLVGLAVSLALHGWAFAALKIDPPDPSPMLGAPARTPAPAPAELTAIEVVRVVEVPEERVLPRPLPQDSRPVVAAAASERNADTEAHNSEVGSRSAGAVGAGAGMPGGAMAQAAPEAANAPATEAASEAAAVAESAPALTYAERLEAAAGSRPAVAMQAQLVAERPVETWAPIEAVPVPLYPQTGQDRAEAEEEGSSVWGTVWRRMGRTFGFGGDKLCRPIPPVAGKAAAGR